MTREEAVKTLREEYCGEKFFCELCNTEGCEIWLAIKALETQPDGNAVSRKDAIRIVDRKPAENAQKPAESAQKPKESAQKPKESVRNEEKQNDDRNG